MGRGHKSQAIAAVLGLLSLLGVEDGLAQHTPKWRLKTRLQAAYEFDSNIREAPGDSSNRLRDSSLRFLFRSAASRKTGRARLSFTYRGGLQTYYRHAVENKLINEVEASASAGVGKIVLALRASGRLKLYLNDVLDYASGSVAGQVHLPATWGFQHRLTVTAAGLNYQNFSAFDYSDVGVSWSISRRITPRLRSSVELIGKRIAYHRQVLFPEQATSFVEEPQRDHSLGVRVHVGYTRRFWLSFNYRFQQNNSNSPDFDYTRHQVTVIFGFPVAPRVWLRGYTAIQVKRYSQKVPQMFPIDIDTEREESNFLILDLSRDLSPSLTALLRLAFYDNESVIRSRFYRKTLVTLGVDFRF
ncbi:MAG: hypothetical protein D6743_04025 [Calditrichaeota bacterium]|nr:MAG: hypothetical protein D6743_04025 [Calditrichota bacterium]